MEIQRAFIDAIEIGKRHRALDNTRVQALAESMATIGLQQPITVYAPTENEVYLVAGLHRLMAAKQLGWEQIDCVIASLDELDRELWEIDENLIRSELSELERARHTARRAEIVGERTSLQNLEKTNPAHRPNKKQTEFVQDTALKTGRSESSIWQDKRRGEKIAPDVQDEIASLDAADKGVELDALASLNTDEQRQAVERVKSGASENFRQAREFITGESEEDILKKRIAKQYGSLVSAWNKADSEAREMFRDFIDQPVFDGTKSGRAA